MIKLIIIDDEAIIRESLKHFIDWQSIGVEVCGLAADGSSGLELIFKFQPDIVLSDINMPCLNGMELIQFLKEHSIKSEVIFISAYSNFEYAQTALRYGAFDYILKPINETELIETVKRCIEKIVKDDENKNYLETLENRKRENTTALIRRLLTEDQYILTKAEQKLLQDENILPSDFKFCVAARVQVEEQKHIDISNQNSIYQIFQLFPEYKIISIYDNIFMIIYIISEEETFSLKKFENDLRWMHERLLSENVFVTITMSSVHPQAENFFSLYTETILAYYLKDSEEAVYQYDKLKRHSRTAENALSINEVVQGIKEGREDIKKRTIYLFFLSFVREEKTDDFAFIKLKCIHFIDSIIQYLKELQLERYLNISLYSSQKNISSQKDIEGVYISTSNFFANLVQCIDEVNQKSSSHLVRAAIDYINENYNEKITLTSVAAYLYVSPTYLSKIFSQETGDPFSRYLLNRRIEGAKKLLRNSNYKIAVIAELCGFNDITHFSKSFKQITGITPHKYRHDLLN